MLRPAPSSISISQSEVAAVEGQLDVYLGLLKQGFKRDDIIRYFAEHQQTSQLSASLGDDLCAPSTVELAIRGRKPLVGHVSAPPVDDVSDEAEEHGSPPEGASPPGELQEHPQSHAPRQSSMLRFGQNASPVRLEERHDVAPEFQPPVRTYRPRTDTYSYNQSEHSEGDLPSGTSSLEDGENIMTPARISSMRPEAKDFVPAQSRRPLRALRSISPLDHGSLLPADISTDEDVTPVAMISLPGRPLSTTRATSPSEADSEDSVTLPAALSNTPPQPAPYKLRSRTVHTTARSFIRPSGAQLDGAIFNIYNDAIPSSVQPQTPADLSRHPLLTERDAAYTAPVGMFHSPTRHIRSHEHGSEDGVQSPTARAITNQGRRARELERTVRVEADRMQRLRVTDRDLMGQERSLRLADGSDVGHDEDSGMTPATDALDWRDELEGDRVGTENWVDEAEVSGVARGPRVVSGNARGFWP